MINDRGFDSVHHQGKNPTQHPATQKRANERNLCAALH